MFYILGRKWNVKMTEAEIKWIAKVMIEECERFLRAWAAE